MIISTTDNIEKKRKTVEKPQEKKTFRQTKFDLSVVEIRGGERLMLNRKK